MYVLFLILFFACLIALVLGRAKPTLFKKINGQPATSKEITIVCGVLMFIFALLAGVTAKSESKNSVAAPSPSLTTVTQAANKPIPTEASTVALQPNEDLSYQIKYNDQKSNGQSIYALISSSQNSESISSKITILIKKNVCTDYACNIYVYDNEQALEEDRAMLNNGGLYNPSSFVAEHEVGLLDFECYDHCSANDYSYYPDKK